MYPFMVKYLKLDSRGVFDPESELFDESKTALETVAQMRVFDDAFPPPKHSLKPGSTVEF
jgi:hypothetical protein